MLIYVVRGRSIIWSSCTARSVRSGRPVVGWARSSVGSCPCCSLLTPLEDLSIKVEVQGLNGFFLPRVSPLNCLLSFLCYLRYLTQSDIQRRSPLMVILYSECSKALECGGLDVLRTYVNSVGQSALLWVFGYLWGQAVGQRTFRYM